MARDFTYVDDIVAGVLAALENPPNAEEHWHRVFNLGNDKPEQLMTLVDLIESNLGASANKQMLGMQKGDVERTWANIDRARDLLGYQPKVSLADGIARYIDWRRGINRCFYDE